MKLSELISYVNTINGLSTQPISDVVNIELRKMLIDMNSSNMPSDLNPEFLRVNTAAQEVLDDLKKLAISLMDLTNGINQHRQEFEKDALIDSYKLYENNQRDTADYFFNTHIPHRDRYFFNTEVNARYNARIKSYSSWKHAGAFVRPLDGANIDSILAHDPLYVIDESYELLSKVKQLFTTEHRSRVRYKVIDESKGTYIKKLLPNAQLGFIVLNDFFTFKPLEVIKQYLNEIYDILKPGGVAMFTYNNCDLPGAARNFEAGMYCYTPASLLKPLVESVGFEIIKSFDNSSVNISWLEIKKPGALESIKGGQALAQIVTE